MNNQPQTKKEWAIYRCKLSCKIGKDACDGKGIPAGIRKEDWIFYQLFSAVEDLARAVEKRFKSPAGHRQTGNFVRKRN